MKRLIRQEKGLLLLEYAVLSALMLGVMLPALAMIADQILDILNDLAEDLDVIDDLVADLDIDGLMPESDEDGTQDDQGSPSWPI